MCCKKHPQQGTERPLVPKAFTTIENTESLNVLQSSMKILIKISRLNTLTCPGFQLQDFSSLLEHQRGKVLERILRVLGPALSELLESVKWSTLNSCAIQSSCLQFPQPVPSRAILILNWVFRNIRSCGRDDSDLLYFRTNNFILLYGNTL